MEMKQCVNGHFYDQSKNIQCPYCNSQSANVNVTRALDVGVTVPVNAPNFERTTGDNERTVAIIKKEIGIDPVVGWLVCVDGKEKGKDYRIHADNNFIGRADKMDICLRGDETISRENHAMLSYDTKGKSYYLSPGEGRSIVRINDKPVFASVELKSFDRIEIGNTMLLFFSICGEEFSWI